MRNFCKSKFEWYIFKHILRILRILFLVKFQISIELLFCSRTSGVYVPSESETKSCWCKSWIAFRDHTGGHYCLLTSSLPMAQAHLRNWYAKPDLTWLWWCWLRMFCLVSSQHFTGMSIEQRAKNRSHNNVGLGVDLRSQPQRSVMLRKTLLSSRLHLNSQ